MTLHNFPERGSFGTVVDAVSHEAAEEACKAEMAATLEDPDLSAEQYRESYGDEWKTVDCWDLDGFIATHINPAILELMGEGLIKMDEEQELMSGDGYEDEDRATFDHQYKAAQALYERTAGVPFYGLEETPAPTPLAV